MHVAIIMDGNGRWASRRGLPRTAGHAAGARAVNRTVEAAARGPIDILTLYAFSSSNWSRPHNEVRHLMGLFRRYLISETARCVENGVRVCVIGRRDRLGADLVQAIECTETLTRGGTRLMLRLAVDYSSREALTQAAEAGGDSSFAERLAADGMLDVDLLIRTGGERRLSDFLLWESAYAELVFVDAFWPDFDENALAEALDQFHKRERRFGGLRPAPCLQNSGAQR
jgi:undecaprenyl diphosphate synthase